MAERLRGSASPYLLQHVDNPVDWWEWSDEAFAEARRRDIPVLLSVGYAACHWCHVMAHESFEDPAVAAVVNESVLPIKVDREERPDVDAVYMTVLQAMTGHGGWPMTVFLTPDGEPFFAGTYFPPEPRHGSASFVQVVHAVASAWRERREDCAAAARQATDAVRAAAAAAPDGDAPTAADLDDAVRRLGSAFDARHGGFGGAPKFPPSMTLEHLIRHHQRTGDPDAWSMARRTLAAMARGGMYDQLGGGFARYSVDHAWVVPHFEKMLYDNALLLRAYMHAWRVDRAPLHRRIAEEVADFLLADLLTPEGGFASSLDADTEGVEGRFYVWTMQQLVEALGPDDAGFAAEALTVTAAGTFDHGASVLQRLAEVDDVERFEAVRRRLLEVRSTRTAPARDDKVVAAWNGLAIAALAEAGCILDRTDLVEAAERAADLLVTLHLVDGPDGRRLHRVSRAGVVGRSAGVLEDYGCVAEGLLTVASVTGEERWFRDGCALLDLAEELFVDEDARLFDTPRDGEQLIARIADPGDNASPSGRSALAMAWTLRAGLTGAAADRERAEALVGAPGGSAARPPRFSGWALAAAEALQSGPLQVAVVGAKDDPRTRALLVQAWAIVPAGAVVALGEPGADGPPLLSDRGLVDGAPAAYPCRGNVCRLPVTTPDDLAREIAAMA